MNTSNRSKPVRPEQVAKIAPPNGSDTIHHGDGSLKAGELDKAPSSLGNEQVPRWLWDELQILGAILRNPDIYAQVDGDLRAEHFFCAKNQALAKALIAGYENDWRVQPLQDLERAVALVEGREAAAQHMRLVMEAPDLCPCCGVNRVLWFTNERRIFLGIARASEVVEEQDLSWAEAFECFFRALELPELSDSGWLARLQSAILTSPSLAYPESTWIPQWKKALEADVGAVDLQVLAELVQEFITCRAVEALPSFTKDAPELTSISPAEGKAAIGRLQRCRLITVIPMVSVDEAREYWVVAPTAKALVPLLKAPETGNH